MLVIGIAVGVCWVVDGVDDDGAVVVDGSEGSFACRVVGGGPADDGGGGGGRCEGGPLLADTRVLIGKMQVATDKLDVAIGDASAGGTSALMPRLNELAQDFSLTSRQLSRVLRILEDTPQGLVFGAPPQPPGPGEAGFNPAGGQ